MEENPLQQQSLDIRRPAERAVGDSRREPAKEKRTRNRERKKGSLRYIASILGVSHETVRRDVAAQHKQKITKLRNRMAGGETVTKEDVEAVLKTTINDDLWLQIKETWTV